MALCGLCHWNCDQRHEHSTQNPGVMLVARSGPSTSFEANGIAGSICECDCEGG
jgi:hypothetical protein